MRSIELTADRRLRLVERPRPAPGPHDVVIQVEAAGICGSDLRTRRYGSLPAGTVLGHEFVGRIAEVGPSVAALAIGDRVVVVPLAWCGRCAWCASGAQQLCTDMWDGSVGLGARPGAFAEYVVVAAASCRPFPADLPAWAGTLVEPFAVGLHATRRSRRTGQPDVPVAILGAGPIGLMVLAAARLSGAAIPVVVAEPNPKRADAARRLGATAVVPAAADVALVLDATPEVAFDCTGSTAALGEVSRLLAPHGELILVSVIEPDQAYNVPGRVWVSQELDCRGSSGYGAADFNDALAAVATRAVDLAAVIGGQRPLDEAEQAFAELSGPDAPVKLVLKP
jgi:threonine dehydrogenase-like Zn-dependent dehydrogenase